MESLSYDWKVLLLLSVIVPVSFLVSFRFAGVIREPQILGGVRYPLMLTMSLNKTAFSLGEPVNISYCLTNIGTETLTLQFTDGKDSFNYVVLAENGTAVYNSQGDIFYPQVYIPVGLEPGGVVPWSWEWRQKGPSVFLGWDHHPPYLSTHVPPGTYSVTGFFTSGTLGMTIETPPTGITISGE